MSLATGLHQRSTRFGAIDAARGFAMLFVCLSHFTAGYLWKTGGQTVASYLVTLSMIASPTFVTVSGMVVGFLAATNPLGFADLRLKLVDRGIFLLIVGHVFLTLTLAPAVGHFGHAYRTSFITDAIGAAIIIGPWVVRSVSPLARLALSVSIFLVAWLAVVQWHPAGDSFTAKLYLVGALSAAGEIGTYPVFAIVPWFAVYLAGTVIGERIGTLYNIGDRMKAHWLLVKAGTACLAVGASAHAVTMVMRPAHVAGSWQLRVLNAFSIYEKFPPGIVYLAFFGGTGLLLLALIFEIDRRQLLVGALEPLRRIGRASLFIFTLQYFMYRTVLRDLALPYTALWPLILLASIVLLASLAAIWDKNGCNRFLTVGITSTWFRSKMVAPFTAFPATRLGN